MDAVKTLIGESGEIQLVPEFEKCVFSSLDFLPDTLGTMQSDHDISANLNYYKWVSAQATMQTYGVVAFTQMPANFTSWNSMSVFVKNEGMANINIRVFDTQGVEVLAELVEVTGGIWNDVALDISGIDAFDWSGKQFKIIFELSSANNEACHLGHVSMGFSKY